MFYAHFVLNKKGPLARIWLAAHWDKKLTKAHVFETNIEQSVEGILQPKVKMALRTSGHLLLGVVRIYSRKTKYLLADCNEAFVKIKMAFRPGMVDLPEDNREAAMNAITLPEVFHDFDTEMPDLNDVDIQAQFSMNQTRAEEITMREDYGNINLETGDDGFGDVPLDAHSPEMLRDVSSLEPDYGTDGVSLAPEGRDYSIADGDYTSVRSESVAGDTGTVTGTYAAGSMFGESRVAESVAGSVRSSARRPPHLGLDAPIQDDGFGGSVSGTGQDILAGGLFEDGSLFEEDEGGLASERVPPSESIGTTFADDPYPGMGSPGGASGPSIGGDSRPASPLEDHFSPPNSPTPSAHSVASKAPSVAPSHHSTRSSRSLAISHISTKAVESGVETTTLIHNEEESFALAPVEASAIKGLNRTKRKRKLIVDEVKAISGEEMKAQLSDTSDIVTTLDLAPPTKRLMHWKETGGVEKLFALPGRLLHGQPLFKHYQRNLTAKPAEDENFESLLGSGESELALETVRGAGEFLTPTLPPLKKEPLPRGRKRKEMEDSSAQSAYAQRQEALAREQEESAREEREKKEAAKRRQKEEEEERRLEASRKESSMLETPAPPSPQSQGFGSPPAQPRGPLYPPGTPVHQDFATPAGGTVPESPARGDHVYPPGSPSAHAGYETPMHQNEYDEGYHNGDADVDDEEDDDEEEEERRRRREPLPLPSSQADFTDQWVSQAAKATESGAAIPPPQTPTHATEWEDQPHHQDEEDQDHYEEEEFPSQVEGEDEEMQEDETIENFEDRVLNKRAAQLHRNLSRRLEESSAILFTGLTRKNDRKQVAQKFYSLLVLQKVMAVEVLQDKIFGELSVSKGPKFDTAADSL